MALPITLCTVSHTLIGLNQAVCQQEYDDKQRELLCLMDQPIQCKDGKLRLPMHCRDQWMETERLCISSSSVKKFNPEGPAEPVHLRAKFGII